CPGPRSAVWTANLHRVVNVYFGSGGGHPVKLGNSGVCGPAAGIWQYGHGLARELHAGPSNHHFRSATLRSCVIDIGPAAAHRIIHAAYPAVFVAHHGRSDYRSWHRAKQRRNPLGSSLAAHELFLRYRDHLRGASLRHRRSYHNSGLSLHHASAVMRDSDRRAVLMARRFLAYDSIVKIE